VVYYLIIISQGITSAKTEIISPYWYSNPLRLFPKANGSVTKAEKFQSIISAPHLYYRD
jgi:hypothetical protein